MQFIQPPPQKETDLLDAKVARERSRLDKTRQSMRLSISQLNSLLKDALGSNAPDDFSKLNCNKLRHVIRYLKRHEARLLLERKK